MAAQSGQPCFDRQFFSEFGFFPILNENYNLIAITFTFLDQLSVLLLVFF